MFEINNQITPPFHYRFCHGFCSKNSRQNLLVIIIVATGSTHGYKYMSPSGLIVITKVKYILLETHRISYTKVNIISVFVAFNIRVLAAIHPQKPNTE